MNSKNTSILAVALIALFTSLTSHASLADLVAGAKLHSDKCIEACNSYYKAHNNLQGFSYANNFVGNWGVFVAQKFMNLLASQNVDVKGEFCKAGKESLEKCYAQDSSIYSVCKLGAKTFASLVTSDPNWIDYFGSCKSKCAEDLATFCNK